MLKFSKTWHQSFVQGVLFDAGQQLLLATNNHTSVIKAGEKPKNKYKEAAEVEGWGEVISLKVLFFLRFYSGLGRACGSEGRDDGMGRELGLR